MSVDTDANNMGFKQMKEEVLRSTEHRLLAWIDFRKQHRITASASSFMLNESSIHPAQVRCVGTEKPYFPLSFFNITRLVVTFVKDKRLKNFIFLATDEKVTSLHDHLTSSIQNSFSEILSNWMKQAEKIEAAKAATYQPLSYVRHSHVKQFVDAHKENFELLSKDLAVFSKLEMLTNTHKCGSNALTERLDELKPFITEWQITKDTHNNDFIEHFKNKEHSYFATVESSPLTEEQILAALTFEDATRVAAAAGSGKSSCIVGKVGFALKAGLFRDSEVLALAYNSDAASGLQERLKNKLQKALGRQVGVASKTFHSFGLSVLLEYRGEECRPKVLTEDGKEEGRFINAVITDLSKNSLEFKQALSDFMLKAAYEDPQPVGYSDDLDECAIQYENCCRERIKAKIDDNRMSFDPTIPTYDPSVYVRSLQERNIANWLILHGIQFKYEEADWDAAKRLNLPKKEGRKRPPYKPDFTYRVTRTLPNGNPVTVRIVHEHFALDENGKAPKWIGGEKYEGHATQKRTMYRAWEKECQKPGEDKVQFFETRSADFYDGTIFDKLRSFFENTGVVIGMPLKEIEDMAFTSFRDTKELEKLIINFVLSFKESGLLKKEVEDKAFCSTNAYRTRLFLRVAFMVFDAYEATLDKHQKIDFADMLRDAITLLNERKVTVPYRFILVDEFQVIQKSRLISSSRP